MCKMAAENILFVHQAADMYGSDKVLLDIVTGLDRKRFYPIVILPWEGPLLDHLNDHGVEAHICRLTRLSRGVLSPKGMFSLPFNIVYAYRDLNRILSSRKIALVHSNTLAVISGALWAKRHGVFHLWHVHEMIVQPLWVRKFYKIMLRHYADSIVFNSRASKELFTEDDKDLKEISQVVWNGVKAPDRSYAAEAVHLRDDLGVVKDEILIVLVGRINRWKGQKLLVDAACHLWQKGVRNLHFLMIGSTFKGCEHFREELVERIEGSDAVAHIHVRDFQEDIWPVWEACDIAIVPSTEPEPFGLVAIEAMAVARPVIAAAHGGLMEIVEHGKTGLLVPPGDVEKTAEAIETLVNAPELRKRMGENGWLRYRNTFSSEVFVDEFARIYERAIQGAGV